MKIVFALCLVMSSSYCFCQLNLSTVSSELIKTNGISKAQENWIYFDEEGEIRNTMEISTTHYRSDGQVAYAIEHTYDIIQTRDSIIFEYDALDRETLRRKIIEINPRNRDLDEYLSELAQSIDTIEEWQTLYELNTVKKINPSSDTATTVFSESGKILLEVNNYERVTYVYNGRDELIKKIEIPFVLTWGRNRENKPKDSIVTTYDELGNPIETNGSTLTINYVYQNGQLEMKEEVNVELGEKRVLKSEFTYDQKGRMISKTHSFNGSPRSPETYEYDESGLLQKVISLNPDTMNIESIVEYTYE